jgi:acetyl-CoA acetyltransferase
MNKSERTLAAVAMLGIFVIISEGWLVQFRDWIRASVGFPSSVNPSGTSIAGGSPVGGSTSSQLGTTQPAVTAPAIRIPGVNAIPSLG